MCQFIQQHAISKNLFKSLNNRFQPLRIHSFGHVLLPSQFLRRVPSDRQSQLLGKVCCDFHSDRWSSRDRDSCWRYGYYPWIILQQQQIFSTSYIFTRGVLVVVLSTCDCLILTAGWLQSIMQYNNCIPKKRQVAPSKTSSKSVTRMRMRWRRTRKRGLRMVLNFK